MRILIVHEKHGNRYFNATSNYELAKVSIKLLKQRFEYKYYHKDDEDYNTIKNIVETNDLTCFKATKYREEEPKAFYYLSARAGYEYENIELVEVEEV